MSITEKALYNYTPRNAGEVPIYSPVQHIRTGAAEGEILFGRALMLGTDPATQLAIYTGAGKRFEGVSVLSISAADLDNEKYLDKDVVGVMESGFISVWAEEVVEPSSPVRIRHTDSGSLVAGSFAKTAEAGKTALVSSGVKFVTENTGAGLVIVKLMPAFIVTDD